MRATLGLFSSVSLKDRKGLSPLAYELTGWIDGHGWTGGGYCKNSLPEELMLEKEIVFQGKCILWLPLFQILYTFMFLISTYCLFRFTLKNKIVTV